MLFTVPALAQTRENDSATNPGVVGQPVFMNGVHVGVAVQEQSQLGLRYEPFCGAYIRPSFQLFTKCHANFTLETILDPTSRTLDQPLGYGLSPRLSKTHAAAPASNAFCSTS